MTANDDFRAHWTLDPEVAFLNHGSFGACPRAVLERQAEIRARMEREPVDFFVRQLETEIDAVRARVADFVGADPRDLAFVTNATEGVNTALAAFDLDDGDEIVVTDHGYNACLNAADLVARRRRARVVRVQVPFPLRSPEDVLERILGAVTERTRIALVDHVTSPTALVFPLERLVAELRARGVETIVDGAHGPGMLPLQLDRLGAAFYTGNAHKWMCAPKSVAIFHVRRDLQPRVRPLSISHGANSPRTDRSRFLLEFDWVGTDDPTPLLSLPAAMDVLGGLLPGGWSALREHNRRRVLAARRRLCDVLEQPLPCPDEMIGSMAAVPLPPSPPGSGPSALGGDELHERLWHEFGVEVPVFAWPAHPERLLRISAQVYNRDEDYERLERALPELLAGGRDAERRSTAS